MTSQFAGIDPLAGVDLRRDASVDLPLVKDGIRDPAHLRAALGYCWGQFEPTRFGSPERAAGQAAAGTQTSRSRRCTCTARRTAATAAPDVLGMRRSGVHRWRDSLFPGGPGKSAEPAEFGTLIDDLQGRVFEALPDDTWVYPGHGDDTTLGAERPSLPEWRSRGW